MFFCWKIRWEGYFFCRRSDGNFGSYVGSSVGNVEGNIEGFLLGEYLFGLESGTEVGAAVGRSGGKVYIKLEGYPLGDALGPGYGTVGSSYDVISYGDGKLEGSTLRDALFLTVRGSSGVSDKGSSWVRGCRCTVSGK